MCGLTPKQMVCNRGWKKGFGTTTIRDIAKHCTWVLPASSTRIPHLLPPTFATRIDEMPYLDRLRFKTTNVFLKLAVCAHQSLMLSQVLRPRFDDERFHVVRGMLSIAIDAPP